MLTIPKAVFIEYVSLLKARRIPPALFSEYQKWLRYYLDFCDKYPVPSSKSERVRLFCEKLQQKGQSEDKRERAAHAVSLYFELKATSPVPASVVASAVEAISPVGSRNTVAPDYFTPDQPNDASRAKTSQHPYYVSEPAPSYAGYASRMSQFVDAGYQEKSSCPEWDAVLEAMADEIKVRHYSRKTLKTYALWTRNFQSYLKNKPPGELGTEDVKDYLTYLAVKCKVAASTQNQAFSKAG